MLDHANASMHIAVLSTLNSCSYSSVFGMVSCPLPVAAVCFLGVCLWGVVLLLFLLSSSSVCWGLGMVQDGQETFCLSSCASSVPSLICEGCSVLYSRPVAPLISCACLDTGSLLPQLCVPKGFFLFVLVEKNIFIFSIFQVLQQFPIFYLFVSFS